MNRYTIARKLTRVQYFEIEAESSVEALAIVAANSGEMVPRNDLDLGTEFYVDGVDED